jgi:endoglucanase
MNRIRRTFIALSVVAAVFGGLLGPVTARAAITGPLHTTGNRIFGSNGLEVRLRGVNTGSLNWYPYIDIGDTADTTNTSFNAMRGWGTNAVRIPLGEQYWFQSQNCRYPISPAAYQNNVATVVDRITSRGMVAVLTLTWNTKFNTGTCNAGQQPMADAPRALNFWSDVANRFKDNPLVVFDLYNEPHDIQWSQWRNGGWILDMSGAWRVAGMQQMYNSVRSTGATNLVFVTGNRWGNLPPDDSYLLDGYNIVYTAHYYTCPPDAADQGLCKPDYWDSAPASDPAPPGRRLDAWTPLSLERPVAVTEFGWPEPDDGTYNQRAIAWAESRGVSWFGFTWNPDKPFGLITDNTTFNPTPVGVPVKNGVALNGTG